MDRRVEMTLSAMRTLVRVLGGIPGRKNLIWLTAGFPFSLIPEEQRVTHSISNRFSVAAPDWMTEEQQRRYAESVRDIAARLSSTQVAIYPLDVCGLGPCAGHDSLASQETMREIARETGGMAFVNMNNINDGVALALQDQTASYTVAYYPENKKWDRSYRPIEVKVNQPGAEVRYRHGYFAIDLGQQKDRNADLDVAEALQDAIPDTQVLFDAKISSIETGKIRVEFMVDTQSVSAEDVDNGKRLSVDFRVAILQPDGKVVAARTQKLDHVFSEEIYQQLLQQGMKLHVDMDRVAGQNVVRLAVQDHHTGYIGTLQAQLQ
jgi:hypothetical protein